MKKAEGYILRQVADEYVLIPCGEKAEEVNEIVTLSETAGFIYEHAEEVKDAEEMVRLVGKEYQINEDIVRTDVTEVLQHMIKKGYLAPG